MGDLTCTDRHMRLFKSVAHKGWDRGSPVRTTFCCFACYAFIRVLLFFSPLLSVFHVRVTLWSLLKKKKKKERNLHHSLTSCLNEGQLGKKLLKKKKKRSFSVNPRTGKNLSTNMCDALSGQTSICTMIQGSKNSPTAYGPAVITYQKGEKGVDVLGV